MPKAPLTTAHMQAIDGALRALNDLVPAIGHAEGCGMDCAEYRRQAEQLVRQLSEIQSRFGPGGRYERGVQ